MRGVGERVTWIGIYPSLSGISSGRWPSDFPPRLRRGVQSDKKVCVQASLAQTFCHFAESEGFEPPVPFSTTVFKTAAIDHSANSPKGNAKILIFFKVHNFSSLS